MEHGKVLMLTSYKGGVGKSTVAANLALSLANTGHKTLLVDCDFGMRCLDLILGATQTAVFDIADAARGRVTCEKAAIEIPHHKGLFLCCAPYRYESGTITPIVFRDTVREMMARLGCEYAVLDTPGSFTEPTELAAYACDTACIVTTMHPTAIRAAERTQLTLQERGVPRRRLILNDVTVDKKRFLFELLTAIDTVGAPLLGVIPHDEVLRQAQLQERIASERNTQTAFRNIVGRLCAKNVPLFSDFSHFNRKKLLKVYS